MSIPTLIFFDKGRALGMVTGALPEDALRQALDLHARGELESEAAS
jgi:thioredoxin-like negative regulator of GroEL